MRWYWVFGWLIIPTGEQPDYPLPDYAWYCLCITLCLVGCTIMIAADAQKYFTLRVRPELITDGMHRYIRHPNYLGEILIYTSFAMMVWHWLPWAVLICFWLGLFLVNMLLKEASMHAIRAGPSTSSAHGGCFPAYCSGISPNYRSTSAASRATSSSRALTRFSSDERRAVGASRVDSACSA